MRGRPGSVDVTAAWAVARLQLAIAVRSPLAWLTAVGFLVLQGVSFAALVAVLSDPARPAPLGAVLESHFGGTLLSWSLQLTVLAALAARAADDRRTGQWEALVAAPVSELAVVTGTWLAALAMYALVWLPTGLYLVILVVASPAGAHIDPGPVVAGYLGELAVGGAALAVATAAGAVARHAVVATVAGFCALLAWLVLGELPTLVPGLGDDHPALVAALARYAPRPLVTGFARGAVAPAAIVWLAGLTAATLALTAALAGIGRRRRADLLLAGYRAVLVGVAAALAAVVVERAAPTLDVSRTRRNSLAPGTTRALAQLDGPVTATVIRPGIAAVEPLFDETERVLALMARRQPALTIARWDPARDPAAAASAAAAAALDQRELVRGGGVLLVRGQRARVIALLDLAEVGRDAIAAPAFTRLTIEQALTRAVTELGDDAPRTLCVTAGHGELPLATPGVAAVVARLAEDGIAVEVIDGLAPVPGRCSAVAVLGAITPLPAADQRGLASYLADGGGLVAVVAGGAGDAPATSGVDDVLAGWGVVVGAGWLDDPAGAVELARGFRVVDGYRAHPIVAGFRGRRVTVWQAARPLRLAPPAEPLIETSAAARVIDGPAPGAAPFAVAAAATRGDGRVVVIAGADALALDPAVRGAGTDLVVARAVAWLVGRTPDAAVPATAVDPLRLVLTGGERRLVAGVAVVGIPALVLALLALVGRRRRR
ncbi:MAG: Gldg family protein [Kofleriaceae bacterium]